jgi:hypothetical protein
VKVKGWGDSQFQFGVFHQTLDVSPHLAVRLAGKSNAGNNVAVTVKATKNANIF